MDYTFLNIVLPNKSKQIASLILFATLNATDPMLMSKTKSQKFTLVYRHSFEVLFGIQLNI